MSTPKVNFVEIARAAYEQGLRRFVVLHPGTKQPIEDEWNDAKPIESADDLNTLQKQHPSDCNCGAVTSKLTNLILDFDDILWLFENFPASTLPETFIVKTGKPGLQMHFLQTDLSRQRLRNAALPNPDKTKSTNVMEVLFDGRQGLLPGCLHPNGNLYETLTGRPLAPIPDYLVEWILKLLDKTSTILKPGQVRPIRPGLDIEQVLRNAGLKSTPLEENGLVYLNHHVDMHMCLVKGSLHAPNVKNNRCCAFVTDRATGRIWYQCFAADCKATPQKTKKALARLGLTLDDLLVEHWRRHFDARADFERAGDLVWQIEGISHEGECTGNVARQKHGKSWFILSKIRALLSGNDWMGHKVSQAKRVILFIPEVGRSSMYRRLKIMRLDQYLDKTLFVRTSALGVPDLGNEEILNACAGADVFMDTLIRFLDGPENNAEVIKVFAEKVFSLLAYARNVEINAHTQKNYDKANDMGPDMFRGSSDIAAFLSNGYGLMQVEKASNRVFVKCLFSRDLPEEVPNFVIDGRPWLDEEGDFRLVDADAGELKDNKAISPLKNVPQEQQSKVKELHAQGLSLREIAAAVGVKSHVTVSNWLKALGLDAEKPTKTTPSIEPEPLLQ